MPIITVAMHTTPPAEKAALIEKLTAVTAEITKIPSQSIITFIQEYDDESIGLGGKTLREARKSR